MTLRDYTANVISASKVVPDGNYKDSKASGVWDINEALDLIKGGNWPNVANINPASFVDALFQTHLYDGNGGTQSIVNNIDLSGKGGLVWAKARNIGYEHMLTDTARGTSGGYLQSDNTSAQSDGGGSPALTAFNNNGFSLGSRNEINNGSGEFVSWTFRKQPKFFDVVTYTGNGTAGITVAHNLGSVPGMIIVRNLANGYSWQVYHRSLANTERIELDNTGAKTTGATTYWNSTTPSSTVFTLGTQNQVNNNGDSFVAYLFAHNDDDGGFGEPGDQDIIKCGDFTTDGSENATVTLGFEPQWVLWKETSRSTNWQMFDAMRGMPVGGNDALIEANEAGAETAGVSYISPTPTGFNVSNMGASKHSIFMAIRRGGMQTPTAASDVFAVTIRSSSDGEGKYTSGFPVDFSLANNYDASGNTFAGTRLTNAHLQTNSTVAEGTSASDYQWDHNDGLGIGMAGAFFGGSTNNINWMWKRARGFFDVLAYTGTGSATTIAHQLGVVPEMIWVKSRNQATDWAVYHKDLSAGQYVMLNKTNAVDTNSAYFTTTAPTSSVFSIGVGEYTNQSSSYTYVAYLFATVAGVSKVGSFSHTNGGGDTNVDCGFTSGSSLVICKRTNDSGAWYIFDSARGIVAGNDPHLELNSVGSGTTGFDVIDPLDSGFTITSGFLSSGTYIFYAIAAIS